MKKIACFVLAIFLSGCEKPDSLAGNSFQLVPLEQDTSNDRFVILEFVNDTEIKIITTTDISGSNSSIVQTQYHYFNNVLRFQGNVFETEKNEMGYELFQLGNPAGKLIPAHEIIRKSILESPHFRKYQD